jgi:excisionase family DNA binding protein
MATAKSLPPPRLLTARELATLLQISLRQLWRLRAGKELPAPIRVGRRSVRWRESDVARYLERR